MNNLLGVRHLYYESVKQMMTVDPKNRVKGQFIRFDYVYIAAFVHYLASFAQIFYLSLVVKEDKSSALEQIAKWDPLGAVMMQTEYYFDPLMSGSVIIVAILYFYFVYLFYYQDYRGSLIGQVLHESVVLDLDSYRDCLRQYQFLENRFSKQNRFAMKWNFWKTFEHGDVRKELCTSLRNRLLKSLPNVLVARRLRMISYHRLFDKITAVLLVFNCSFDYLYTMFFDYYLPRQIPESVIWLYIIVECIVAFCFYTFSAKIHLILLFFSWYLTKLYRCCVEDSVRQFRVQAKALNNVRQANQSKNFRLLLLHRAVNRHMSYTRHVLSLSREFFSRTLLLFFTCSFPLNTVTILSPFVKEMKPEEKAECYWMFAFGSLVSAAFLLPMARLSDTIHQPGHSLPRIQLALGRSAIHCKLKLESLYSALLLVKPRYGISIGSLTTVTYSIIFEIIIAYGAFLIFTLKFYHTKNLL